MDQPVCVRLTPPSHVKEFEPGNFPDSNCVSVEIKTSSRLWPAIRSCGAAKDGGADRDRTDDLKLAKLALSQLSYGPGVQNDHGFNWSGSPSRSSRQAARLRPLGFGAAAITRFAREGWWARDELNVRPHAYQACALTT